MQENTDRKNSEYGYFLRYANLEAYSVALLAATLVAKSRPKYVSADTWYVMLQE